MTLKRIVSLFGDESEVFIGLNDKAKAYAASRGLEYAWVPMVPYTVQKAIAALRGADAGVIDVEPYGDEIFKEIASRNRLLVRFGVGFDKVDLAAATRHGISISRTTGANTLGVAEMAVTLILSARRMLGTNRLCIDSGKWVKNVAHETIGATVGIVGFGAIGQAVAGLLSGFGCRLIAYDPFPNQAVAEAKGVELVGLERLFKESDAISLHLPYSKETHMLVGDRLLSTMKLEAVIVNTARGNIIDEAALFRALSERRIAGAGLDVFGQEPLPTSSPLIGLDNIILAPHVSSQTHESLWRIYEMAIDIAADAFEGKPVRNLLNPDCRPLGG